jgi:hypothetical protein
MKSKLRRKTTWKRIRGNAFAIFPKRNGSRNTAKKPEIMKQKIIVFPMNIGKSHWVTTFVFNPGNVLSNQGSLRTCFFRYCSNHPSGNGDRYLFHGISWFLNLAHSCEMHHSKDADADEGFKLHFPFGHELDGKLLGTPEFPAMKVRKDADLVLPKQRDVYSCGLGIAAGIAIVLNSLLGRNAADDNTVEPTLTNEGDIEEKGIHSCFSSTFQCENLEVHLNVVCKDEDEEVKEAVCYFPTELFPPYHVPLSNICSL